MRRVLCVLCVLLVVLSLAVLGVGIGAAAVQEVLKLDEKKSYVRNLDTGIEQNYTDILDSEQLEGNMLEFHIYVSKTGNPILDDYVLELRTNMDSPEWKFGDDLSHSANWIVWKGTEAHEHVVPKVILSGEVPKPIRKVKEPGFEGYDLYGIGEKDVYVELTVGTTRDAATLDTIIQRLEPTMTFFSTSEAIRATKREMDTNLEEAKAKIGDYSLEEDIKELYEAGHPGWASKLSEHYNELSVGAEPKPVGLYAIIALMLGLILGAGIVYVYVSRGGGKGMDLSEISSELDDTSGRIADKSSAINTLSTRFARSADEEQRNTARELLKIRASLNELANEIRTIADRIRGSR